MSLLSIAILLMVILLMSCAIYLVYIGAEAVQDPNHPFGEIEFAISSIALLGCAILISYFAIVYVVIDQEPDVPQSSPPTNNVVSINGVELDPDYKGQQFVVYDKLFKVPLSIVGEKQQLAYMNLVAAREWSIKREWSHNSHRPKFKTHKGRP